jgi:hypothetical protein
MFMLSMLAGRSTWSTLRCVQYVLAMLRAISNVNSSAYKNRLFSACNINTHCNVYRFMYHINDVFGGTLIASVCAKLG